MPKTYSPVPQKLLLLFLFLLLFAHTSNAQTVTNQSSDSTDFAFLPAIAYNSDYGLIGGGISSWYHYKDNIHPFYSYTTIAAIISTKGLLSFDIFYDKPHTFGSEVRMTHELFIGRFFEDSYYGIGNYGKLEDTPDGIPDYYYFRSFSIGYETISRFPLLKGSGFRQLDAKGILNFDYETPWENKNDILFSIEKPTGFEGGRSLYIGGGLIWENRDHEFRPSRGNFAELTIEGGNELWGSSFNTLHLEFDARQYVTFHLLKDVTFANRLYFDHTNGQVPYWKLSYAGGEETMRGYPSRRFIDDNVVLWNTELRTWLFDIKELDSRFGGTLFFDLGRTFPNGASFPEITSDLKYSAGFAGTASFFTPDFIIRCDVGFSEEGTGIYITSGYMF